MEQILRLVDILLFFSPLLPTFLTFVLGALILAGGPK